MNHWKRLKERMGFTDDDAARLAELRDLVEGEIPAILSRFCTLLLEGSGLDSQARTEVLPVLQRLLDELLGGPYDNDYWHQRQEAGRAFLKRGLQPRNLFSASHFLRTTLITLAHRTLEPALALPTIHAVNRVIDLDLAVFTTHYMKLHETQQLRSLQDLIVRNMPVTVLCLDERGRVTAATRPSARLFGASAEEGRHYETFLPPGLVEAADLPSRVGEVLATGETATIPRVRFGEGSKARYFRINLVPLEHPLARLLLHVEELTEVIRAEARLSQADSATRMGLLANSMANEIRNPLTGIASTLQVLSRNLPVDDRQRAVLDKVQGQVARLDRLVADLYAFARPIEPVIRPVTLAVAVEDSITLAGLPVEVEILESEEVDADPELVQQILLNLLQNAAEASGPGGRIHVQVGPGPVVRVTDDGPGVSEEARQRLFDPFVTTKSRGTGLGLAISQNYAKAMGGSLSLERSPPSRAFPVGACFRLEL